MQPEIPKESAKLTYLEFWPMVKILSKSFLGHAVQPSDPQASCFHQWYHQRPSEEELHVSFYNYIPRSQFILSCVFVANNRSLPMIVWSKHGNIFYEDMKVSQESPNKLQTESGFRYLKVAPFSACCFFLLSAGFKMSHHVMGNEDEKWRGEIELLVIDSTEG